MKTLVLHPEDISTDFLKVIYEGKGFTVITKHPSKSKLKGLIKDHDRIIILGHGCESGMGDLKKGIFHFWIKSDMVYLLKEKKSGIYIWCNSDVFVEKYGLKGFYTGMFISEFEEAYSYSVSYDGSDIDNSNNLFSSTVSKYLSDDTDKMCESVKKEYKIEKNNIVNFNNFNLKSK